MSLPPVDTPGLTAAEKRVVELAGVGMSDVQIAEDLNIRKASVKQYLQRARQKYRDHCNLLALKKETASGAPYLRPGPVRPK